MNIKRLWNTKQKGRVEYLYSTDKNGVVGVCLTFNIIEEGKDIHSVRKALEIASRLHLETVRKDNLSDDLLNRYADEKWWKIYFETLEQIRRKSVDDNMSKLFGIGTQTETYRPNRELALR